MKGGYIIDMDEYVWGSRVSSRLDADGFDWNMLQNRNGFERWHE